MFECCQILCIFLGLFHRFWGPTLRTESQMSTHYARPGPVQNPKFSGNVYIPCKYQLQIVHANLGLSECKTIKSAECRVSSAGKWDCCYHHLTPTRGFHLLLTASTLLSLFFHSLIFNANILRMDLVWFSRLQRIFYTFPSADDGVFASSASFFFLPSPSLSPSTCTVSSQTSSKRCLACSESAQSCNKASNVFFFLQKILKNRFLFPLGIITSRSEWHFWSKIL